MSSETRNTVYTAENQGIETFDSAMRWADKTLTEVLRVTTKSPKSIILSISEEPLCGMFKPADGESMPPPSYRAGIKVEYEENVE